MRDYMFRVLTDDDVIRASVANTTALVKEVCKRQQTDPTASVAIGRLATAVALMGCLVKGQQRIGVSVEGNGPLKKIQAETDAFGHVRATVKVAHADLPPRNGRYDVPGAIGRAGFLHVVKDLCMKEPYRGMVQLVSSEIAEDLAYYFTTSEQTPSSVALGVDLDSQGQVVAAGGFLIQLMPEASEEAAERLSLQVSNLPPTTALIRQGFPPEAIAEKLFEGFPYRGLGTTPLTFSCTCSLRHVVSLLRALGDEELEDLMAEKVGTTVTCEYCKQPYKIDHETLREIKESF